MRLGKTLENKINFAKFAIEHKIDPYELAVLCHLVNKRFNFAVKTANTRMDQAASERSDKRDDDHMQRIADKALSLGFTDVVFSSLYPSMKKDGRDIHLPV